MKTQLEFMEAAKALINGLEPELVDSLIVLEMARAMEIGLFDSKEEEQLLLSSMAVVANYFGGDDWVQTVKLVKGLED